MNERVSDLIPSGDDVLTVADTLPLMVSFVSREGFYLYANKACADWYGLDRDDILGKHVADIIGNETYTARQPYFERALSGETVEFEGKLAMMGELRDVAVKLVPHPCKIDGEVPGFYRYVQDITAKKRMEASEARHRAIFDTALDGIFVINEGGVIQSFNAAAERMFGYSPDEVVGQKINMLMPPGYARSHDAHLLNYINGGPPKVIGTPGVHAFCLRKNGSTFPADLSVAEWRNGDERFFTGVVRDVTERDKGEAALRASREELRRLNADLEAKVAQRARDLKLIYDHSHDIIASISAQGTYESVNSAFERVTGFPVGNAIGSPFIEFVFPDDVALTEAEYARMISSPEHMSGFENRILTADGGYRWVSWTITPLPEENRAFAFGRDVTEAREREEALRQAQKMDAIGQLTGGIAHDFNNLLAGIIGSLDLLRNRIADGRITELSQGEKYLDASMTAAKRAAGLTHRLLAFARRQPLSPSVVSVNDLAASMELLLDRTIGPSIEMRMNLGATWVTLCDPNQLENGLLNLVLNARDALPEASGTISIETVNVAPTDCRKLGVPAREYVRITVTDNGAGMTEDVKSKCFDPFFTTKPIGQGTGLGLSMLYGFVKQSDGHVRLNTKPGAGTSVHIYLPRSEKTLVVLGDTETVSTPGPVAPGTTVLLVEDEPGVREVMLEVLTTCGYTAIEAAEAESALRVIRSERRIDLLLSDVGLPGMNGRQLAEAAREHRPDLRVLFVTGYAPGATVKQDFLDRGMEMITKPFNVDALATKIAEMIEHSRSPKSPDIPA